MSDNKLISKRNVILIKDEKQGKYISKFSNIGTGFEQMQFTNKEQEALFCTFEELNKITNAFLNKKVKLSFEPRTNHETTSVFVLELIYAPVHPQVKVEQLMYRTMNDLMDGLKSIPFKLCEFKAFELNKVL